MARGAMVLDFSLCINRRPKLHFEVERRRELSGGLCEYKWQAMHPAQPTRGGLVRHNPRLGMVDLTMKVLQAYSVWDGVTA